MTVNQDQEREDDRVDVYRDEEPGSRFAAALAVSVLIVATITLTLVAGGVFSAAG